MKVFQPTSSWIFRIACLALASAGFLAVWLPWFLMGARKNMIDGMCIESIALLFVLGAVAGTRLRLNSAWIGVLTVSLFPVMAIVEAILRPETHNLLGLEILMYGFLALPASLGSLLGRKLKLARRKQGDD